MFQHSLAARFLSELIGTFILVFMGAGSVISFAVAARAPPAEVYFGVGFTFAIAVAVVVYSLGHVSGAHINPAVTLALTSVHRFPAKDVIPYIVAQLIGAVSASAANGLIYGYSVANQVFFGLTLPGSSIGENALVALVNEIVMTFILMWVIMGVAVSGKAPAGWGGWSVGLVVGALIWYGDPIDGASLNPARTFGPAILSWNFTAHWVYWVGPIVGAVLAALIYEYAFIRVRNSKMDSPR